MLDPGAAALHGVKAIALRQQVSRNEAKFPRISCVGSAGGGGSVGITKCDTDDCTLTLFFAGLPQLFTAGRIVYGIGMVEVLRPEGTPTVGKLLAGQRFRGEPQAKPLRRRSDDLQVPQFMEEGVVEEETPHGQPRPLPFPPRAEGGGRVADDRGKYKACSLPRPERQDRHLAMAHVRVAGRAGPGCGR